MPVDATWRIQSKQALVTATSSFTASLDNPTQPGSMLLLFVGTSGSGGVVNLFSAFDPPFYQEALHVSQWYAFRRDSQPAGETSWAIPTIAVSSTYYWRVEEWGGMSSVGQPDASGQVDINASSLTVSTDTISNITADVDDFAALAVFRVAFVGASGWPAAHSYGAGASAGPSSWNEVAWLVNGDGTVSTHFILGIAEAYPGVTGNVGCTLTLDTTGGGGTPGAVDGWGVLYKPAAAAPPQGVLTG